MWPISTIASRLVCREACGRFRSKHSQSLGFLPTTAIKVELVARNQDRSLGTALQRCVKLETSHTKRPNECDSHSVNFASAPRTAFPTSASVRSKAKLCADQVHDQTRVASVHVMEVILSASRALRDHGMLSLVFRLASRID